MPTAILSSNALLQSGREFPPYCKYVSLLVVFPLAFVAFFTAWLFSQFQGETQEYLNLKKKKKKNERKEENMHKDSLICLIILIWAMIWSQQKGPWDELSDCLQLWFTSCVPCAHKPPAAAGGSAGCDPHTAPTSRAHSTAEQLGFLLRAQPAAPGPPVCGDGSKLKALLQAVPKPGIPLPN